MDNRRLVLWFLIYQSEHHLNKQCFVCICSQIVIRRRSDGDRWFFRRVSGRLISVTPCTDGNILSQNTESWTHISNIGGGAIDIGVKSLPTHKSFRCCSWWKIPINAEYNTVFFWKPHPQIIFVIVKVMSTPTWIATAQISKRVLRLVNELKDDQSWRLFGNPRKSNQSGSTFTSTSNVICRYTTFIDICDVRSRKAWVGLWMCILSYMYNKLEGIQQILRSG